LYYSTGCEIKLFFKGEVLVLCSEEDDATRGRESSFELGAKILATSGLMFKNNI